jgi:hypothetical protein
MDDGSKMPPMTNKSTSWLHHLETLQNDDWDSTGGRTFRC